MALVYDNQIKEVWRKFFICISKAYLPCHSLINRKIDLISLVHFLVADLSHFPIIAIGVKELKIFTHGIIHKYIPIRQKQNSFFRPRFPKSINDLKRCIGLTSTGCHRQQQPVLPTGNRFNSPVNGITLIVSGFSIVIGIIVIILCYNFFTCLCDTLEFLVTSPQFFRRRELIQVQFYLNIMFSRLVIKRKTITVRCKHKGYI